MDPVFVVGPGRSRAKPHVVVEFRGRLTVGHERIGGPVHAHQTDQDALDFADATVADVFRRLEELGFGTLLAAALDDAIGCARRLHQRLAFLDEQRERFLAINILARQTGFDGRQRMPVVRRGDQDRVNGLVLQQLPVIAKDRGLAASVLLDQRGRARGVGLVHIAYGHHLLHDRAHIRDTLATGANHPDANEFARVLACSGEGFVQEKVWKREAGADTERRLAQKLTTIHGRW